MRRTKRPRANAVGICGLFRGMNGWQNTAALIDAGTGADELASRTYLRSAMGRDRGRALPASVAEDSKHTEVAVFLMFSAVH